MLGQESLCSASSNVQLDLELGSVERVRGNLGSSSGHLVMVDNFQRASVTSYGVKVMFWQSHKRDRGKETAGGSAGGGEHGDVGSVSEDGDVSRDIVVVISGLLYFRG